MQEFIHRVETEIATGEREGYGFTPDELETLDSAYTLLTNLVILGNDMHNEKLVVASQNLQDVIDTL